MSFKISAPRFLVLAAIVLCCLAIPGPHATAEDLTLYSGRSKGLVDPLIKLFERQTGLKVSVRYGNTAQLALALQEEGERSPADVFWAQDASALGAVARDGLFVTLPAELSEKVPRRFRSPDNQWLAVSGRARVLAYSDELTTPQLPTSILELTDPKWNGKVGWAPTNASFHSFVTAMRVAHGEEATRQWLLDMKNNGTKSYAKNTPIIEALAAREIQLGLPNHYYLLNYKKANPDYPVQQRFFADGDIGNLVNIAGVGILKTAAQPDNARRFVEFLLSPVAQQYFTSDVMEYPLIDEVAPNAQLESFERLREVTPDVELDQLDDLDGTLKLLQETGLL